MKIKICHNMSMPKNRAYDQGVKSPGEIATENIRIPEQEKSLLQVEPRTGVDFRKWAERSAQIIQNIIQLEADAMGIDPTVEAIANWMISRLNKETHSQKENESIRSLSSLPANNNPFILKLLYDRHRELFEVENPDDVFSVCEPILPKLAKLGSLSMVSILPNNFSLRNFQTRPTICLSRQNTNQIKLAKKKGEFAGRIGFSGDGVNDFIVEQPEAWVLITPFQKLANCGPTIPRQELGFASEKEYAWCTGIPVEAIDVILPARLFPRRVPDFVTEGENWQRASHEQREKFLERYTRQVNIPMPNEYAASLRYNYEKTGELLSPKQKKILEKDDFTVDKFWNAALLPLREFTMGSKKDYYQLGLL